MLWIMSGDQDQDKAPRTKDMSHCIEFMCKDDMYGVPALDECLQDFLMDEDCKQTK